MWRYKHANFEKENRLIESLDMTSILDPDDIDYSWENWIVEFLRIMNECVPKATLINRSNIPWLTKDLVQLNWKRNYLYTMARKLAGWRMKLSTRRFETKWYPSTSGGL